MNTEVVADIIRNTGHAHVKVYKGRMSEKAVPLFCSSDWYQGEEEENPDQSATFFEDFMQRMPDGPYTARIQKAATSPNTSRIIPFKNYSEDSADPATAYTQSLQGIYPGITGPGDLRSHIDEQVTLKLSAFMAEMKAEQEKQALRDEISGLKEELRSSKGWEPKLNYIFRLFTEQQLDAKGIPFTAMADVAKTTVSGHDEEEEEEVSKEESDELNVRVNRSMSEMAGKIGGETAILIEKLSALDAEQLEKLAAMPEENIRQLAAML